MFSYFILMQRYSIICYVANRDKTNNNTNTLSNQLPYDEASQHQSIAVSSEGSIYSIAFNTAEISSLIAVIRLDEYMDRTSSLLILTSDVFFHTLTIFSNGKRIMVGVLKPTPSYSKTVFLSLDFSRKS